MSLFPGGLAFSGSARFCWTPGRSAPTNGRMLPYIKGRNTKDVNLLMSVEVMRRVAELEIEDENNFFARARFRTVQVDLLLTRNPLFKTVEQRFAAVHQFAEL